MIAPRQRVGDGGKRPLAAAIGYLAFVVYGSLVPLDFHPAPLADAWPAFLRTNYLNLGVDARADWVANILLYIPLAYLWCATLAHATRHALGRMLGVALVFLGCALLAVAVEFTQQFFPPRTVSLNDIVAEFIGSALGAGVWLVFGASIHRLRTEMSFGGPIAFRAAIAIYVLAYVAFSLFPYDVLVSANELAAKLTADGYAPWLVPQSCGRAFVCIAKFVIEAVAAMPVGLLLGPILGPRSRHPIAAGLLAGAVLGLTIEVAQLFIASGVSEGASVVMRAVGVAAGVGLYRAFDAAWLVRLRSHAAAVVVVLSPLYLAGLAWANRWFTTRWTGAGDALVNLREVHLLPFYYHYYTTETLAVQSLLATVVMYSPVGAGYWIWREGTRPGIAGFATVPGLIAGLVALVVECGKLYLPDGHPDPTNVLIAFASASLAYALIARVQRWAVRPAERGTVSPAAAPDIASGELVHAPRELPEAGWTIATALLLLAGALAAMVVYPPGAMYLAVPLALWATLLWRHPRAGLAVAVALLPLLDLSAWTGWVVINEFDVFIAITVAVALLRMPAWRELRLLDRPARFALALLALSFVASAVVGLTPLSPPDGNALYSPMTSYAALRGVKGPMWALLMIPLLCAAGSRREARMTDGIVAGLCYVAVVVVWQRVVFAGLFDTATDYRVEGPFPELRLGGGDIHAYLVLASPFIVAWTMRRPTPMRIALGIIAFAVASYALAVTFARGGYAGFATALVVVAIIAIMRSIAPGRRRKRTLAMIVIMLGCAAAVLTTMSGSYMRMRLSASASEAGVRMQHWSRAVGLIDSGPVPLLFGMGLGSFPRTVLFKDRALASASLSYERSDGTTFARLGAGRPLYLEQRVAIEPERDYTLSFDARAAGRDAAVAISLCAKSLQSSFGCKALVSDANLTAIWQHRSVAFNSGSLGAGPIGLRRPVLLSLSNAGTGATVDVRDVRLEDPNGVNLVGNGAFARGGSNWTIAADDHLPWHVFNLWVEILFEQGWFGIVAFVLVIVLMLARTARSAAAGDWFAAAVLAATAGFLVTGFSESLFDGPRVTTLFFLLVIAGLASRVAVGAPAR